MRPAIPPSSITPPPDPARYLRLHIFPEQGGPVYAHIVTANRDVQAHSHDFVELALILAGQGVHFTAQGERLLQAGDVVVVPPGLPGGSTASGVPGAWHAYRDCTELVIYNCCFAQSLLERELAWLREDPLFRQVLWPDAMVIAPYGVLQFALRPETLEQSRQALDALRTVSDTETRAGTQATTVGLLLLFLGGLAGDFSTHLEARPPLHPAMAQLVRSLQGDLAYPWTLPVLASAVALDPSYVVRLFRAQVGLSPMAYLARCRAERATALLLHTDLPIAAIARLVGWPEPAHFARRFKAHMGMSAQAYRARLLPGT